MTPNDRTEPGTCRMCNGALWVCEFHPDKDWEKCCGGAGRPCKCNPEARDPPGFTAIYDAKGDYRQ